MAPPKSDKPKVKSTERLLSEKHYTGFKTKLHALGVDIDVSYDEIKETPNPDLKMVCHENGHEFSLKPTTLGQKFSAVKYGKIATICQDCTIPTSVAADNAKALCEDLGYTFIQYFDCFRVSYACSCGSVKFTSMGTLQHVNKTIFCEDCKNTRRQHTPAEISDGKQKVIDGKLARKKLYEEKEATKLEERNQRMREQSAKLEAQERQRVQDLFDFVESEFSKRGCTLLSKSCRAKLDLLDYICECGEKAKITFSDLKKGRRCNDCKQQRCLASSFHKKKTVVSPNGKEWTVIGYEDRYIRDALQNGIVDEDLLAGKIKEIPICRFTYGGKGRRWYPDAFIKSTSTIIEVKSNWTYSIASGMMKAKMEYCPHNCELWVYSDKKLLETVKFDCKTKQFSYLNGNVFQIGYPVPGTKVPVDAPHAKIDVIK